MRGYKGMSKDMTCRGMQFEIGKTYHVDGEIELCKNGLHFCQILMDVFDFYKKDGENRFFEVETDKSVSSDKKKSVTAELTILRELTDIEVNRAYYGNGYGYGDGDGYGNGYGDGDGYGNGYGDGYGNGYGDGYGDGYGYGDGNGYGDGYGNGYGDGDGYNIQKVLVFND